MNDSVHLTYLTTNNLRFHAAVAGPKGGKPVILLHGFPEFWYGWRGQIGPLAEAGFRVAAPDQRGYNRSDKPEGLEAYRLDVLARDIVGIIDALGAEKACLVGHDWGGVAAWAAAMLYPERVERMAILNAPYPLAFARTLLRHPEQLLRSAYVYFFQLPWLPEAILRNRDWEALVKGMQTSSRPGTFSHEDFERYRQAWWKPGAMTAMLNWYRTFLRRPVRLPFKPRIATPTLLLWGAKDFALGRELAQASLDLCEAGELIFFEEATHWLQHEEPERVNRLLADFLDG